jgi:hypothetical protein
LGPEIMIILCRTISEVLQVQVQEELLFNVLISDRRSFWGRGGV